MSSNILTPPAVGSEAKRATRRLWRAVEAQHIASTLRLVANVEEQLVLERLLEKSKPPVPSLAADLHFFGRRLQLQRRLAIGIHRQC